jgi:hypothetical protein
VLMQVRLRAANTRNPPDHIPIIEDAAGGPADAGPPDSGL